VAKKKLASERGKQSASKQGKDVGSRKSFTLPAKCREQPYKQGKKTRLQFSSPGKTKYKTQKAVTEALEANDMRDCRGLPVKVKEEIERRLCESTQLMDMVDQINQTCKSSTSDCNGKLI